jgi:hypothetical protein
MSCEVGIPKAFRDVVMISCPSNPIHPIDVAILRIQRLFVGETGRRNKAVQAYSRNRRVLVKLKRIEKRNGCYMQHLSERLKIRTAVYFTLRLHSSLVNIEHSESMGREIADNGRRGQVRLSDAELH